MFDRKWILQLFVLASAVMTVRSGVHSLLGKTDSLQPQVATAELFPEARLSHPTKWKTGPATSVTNRKNVMTAMPIAIAKPALTSSVPFAAPKTPEATAAAAAAKAAADKKAAAAKKTDTKTATTSPTPPYNPAAQNPTPTPAAGATQAGTGGSLISGPMPASTSGTSFVPSAAGTTATSSLTEAQVMAELFPNGFTQDGMTKLLALRSQNKISSAVYYQVVSEAAYSTSSTSQALAITALEASPSSQAFTILATMTEKSPTSSVSASIATAMQTYQSTQMLSYLASPIQSADSTVRYQALIVLNAGAQAVLTQLTSIAGSSTSTTQTTASANVQSFFATYVTLLTSLEKTETDQKNAQEEATTLAAINTLMNTASSVQAYARR